MVAEPPTPDDHPAGAGVDRRARSARRCRRSTPRSGRCRSAPPTSVEARGPRHLDHGGRPVEPPRPPRPASPSGPVTVVDAVGAAERVQRALAAVGHRHLVAAPTRGAPPPAAMAAATSRAVAVPRNLSGAARRAPRPCWSQRGRRDGLSSARCGRVAWHRPVVLVSNRGPLSFPAADDGERAGRQARRGRARVGPRARSSPAPTRVWIAAAMTDGDREAAAAGSSRPRASGSACSRSTPPPTAWPTTWSCNATLWFLHHGLFDLARRPRVRRALRARRGTPTAR